MANVLSPGEDSHPSWRAHRGDSAQRVLDRSRALHRPQRLAAECWVCAVDRQLGCGIRDGRRIDREPIGLVSAGRWAHCADEQRDRIGVGLDSRAVVGAVKGIRL